MKKRALLLALLLLLAALPARAQEFTGYTGSCLKTENVAEGVVYSSYRLRRDESNYLRRLHVLEIDPKANPRLMIRYAVEGGQVYLSRKKVSQFVEQDEEPGFTALAAVNGDFFDTAIGGPLGHSMREGRWLTAGEFPEGWAMGIRADGSAVIGQPRVALSLFAERNGEALLEGVRIDALNALRGDTQRGESGPNNALKARQDNALVLLTRDWSGCAHTKGGGVEIVIAVDGDIRTGETLAGRVLSVHDETGVKRKAPKGDAAGAAIVPGTAVLSGIGPGAEMLSVLEAGDDVFITCEADPLFDGAVTVAGGGRPDGGPLLVRDGQVCAFDKAALDDGEYFYGLNSRTVFGIRADGTYFFLNVERNQERSCGMTIDQTARAALDLGAVIALNLDGGTSSTMALRGKQGVQQISLCTSNGEELAVGSALILYERQ